LAAGTYPWTIVPIAHGSWQGLLSLDKPGAAGAGLSCYKVSVEQHDIFYRLPGESINRSYSSSTFLTVFAISLLVRGFKPKTVYAATATTTVRHPLYPLKSSTTTAIVPFQLSTMDLLGTTFFKVL